MEPRPAPKSDPNATDEIDTLAAVEAIYAQAQLENEEAEWREVFADLEDPSVLEWGEAPYGSEPEEE